MANKQHRDWAEMKNLFSDPKFSRQAWKSVGIAIAMQPAVKPIQVLDKDGNETFNSQVESYSYNKLAKDIKDEGFRVDVDHRSEGVGYKIRQAQLMRTNYMLVVGEVEENSGKLTVRNRDGEETKDVSFDEFIEKIKKERDSKSLESIF